MPCEPCRSVRETTGRQVAPWPRRPRARPAVQVARSPGRWPEEHHPCRPRIDVTHQPRRPTEPALPPCVHRTAATVPPRHRWRSTRATLRASSPPSAGPPQSPGATPRPPQTRRIPHVRTCSIGPAVRHHNLRRTHPHRPSAPPLRVNRMKLLLRRSHVAHALVPCLVHLRPGPRRPRFAQSEASHPRPSDARSARTPPARSNGAPHPGLNACASSPPTRRPQRPDGAPRRLHTTRHEPPLLAPPRLTTQTAANGILHARASRTRSTPLGASTRPHGPRPSRPHSPTAHSARTLLSPHPEPACRQRPELHTHGGPRRRPRRRPRYERCSTARHSLTRAPRTRAPCAGDPRSSTSTCIAPAP